MSDRAVNLDLETMRERARVAADHPTWSVAYAEDVPRLLAEIDRLRKESDEVLGLQCEAVAEAERLREEIRCLQDRVTFHQAVALEAQP